MSQSLVRKYTNEPFGVFQASPSWIAECEWCGHPVKEHGKEGCEHERKIWFDGIAVDGPCGCDAVIAEPAPEEWLPTRPLVNAKMLITAACCVAAVAIGAYLFVVEWFSL